MVSTLVSDRELHERTRCDGRVKGMLRRTAFRLVEKAYFRLEPAAPAVVDLRHVRDFQEAPAPAAAVNWAEGAGSGALHYDIADEALFDEKVATFLDLEVGNGAERNWLLPS